MEHIIKQLKNGAKHARLSSVEKEEINSALFHYVSENPVNIQYSIPSPFNIYNFRNKKSISALVLGGLLMGSSVSFAAEDTVPGDVLFPVKIHVNEAVRGATAVTQKAKAEWEIRLVERRLEEVEKLAVAQNVPVEVRQIAEQNLENYAERVKNRIAKFENDEDDEDALGTASLFSEVLNAHERTISELEDNDDDLTEVIATSTYRVTASIDNTSHIGDEPLRDVIEKIREVRGDAERKHKDLKKKYHREDVNENSGGEGNLNDAAPNYIQQAQSTNHSSIVIQTDDETDIEVKEKIINDDRRTEEIGETPMTSHTPSTSVSREIDPIKSATTSKDDDGERSDEE